MRNLTLKEDYEYPKTKSWPLQPHHGTCSHIMAPAGTYYSLYPHIGTWSSIFKSSMLVAPETGFLSKLLASEGGYLRIFSLTTSQSGKLIPKADLK